MNEDGEEQDPREELVQKLLEYKMYKYMSYELRDKMAEASRCVFKPSTYPSKNKTQPWLSASKLQFKIDGSGDELYKAGNIGVKGQLCIRIAVTKETTRTKIYNPEELEAKRKQEILAKDQKRNLSELHGIDDCAIYLVNTVLIVSDVSYKFNNLKKIINSSAILVPSYICNSYSSSTCRAL